MNNHEETSPKKDSTSAAIKKAMDYLAMRDHSRGELEMKLAKHDFLKSEIEQALNHIERTGWLIPPHVLAEKVAEQLHRKKKSYYYIIKYLQSKKLPQIPKDSTLELEKAQSLVSGRFSRLSNPSPMDKKKMAQFLKNRGFDLETIMRVIHETSGHSESF